MSDEAKLTGHDVDNVDGSDTTEHTEDALHIGEHNGNQACGRLEQGRADVVEFGRDLVLVRDHVVQTVPEGDVVQHDVRHHCAHDQHLRGDQRPVEGPVRERRRHLQDDRRGVLEGRQVATDNHADVQDSHDEDSQANHLHEPALYGVLQLRVNWQHVALVCEGE